MKILVVCLLCVICKRAAGKGIESVTCGSAVKLVNTYFKVRLHSHSLHYATGSEQQSVTGTESEDDINSHWVVRGRAQTPCFRGEPIRCGSVVRLTHLPTDMNLHSHHYLSPLSEEQEVSAYKNDRDNDTDDHWEVVCDGEFWGRDDEVKLKHVNTEVYLGLSGKRFGRPIEGQYEVVGVQWPGDRVRWRVTTGVFIHPPEPVKKKFHAEHSEL